MAIRPWVIGVGIASLLSCRTSPFGPPPSPALVLSSGSNEAGGTKRDEPAGLRLSQSQDEARPAGEPVTDLPALPWERYGEKWVFSVAPYAWLLGVDGDARIGGNDVDVNTGFGDILDDLDFVAEGRIAAVKGDWGIKFDGTYSELETSGNAGPIDVTVDTKLGLYLLSGTYRLYQGELRGNDQVRVDGVLGFLNTTVESKTSSNLPALDGLKADESWVDLYVGGDAFWQLDRRNLLRTSVIAGGWDLLGDSSDSIWGLELGYGRSFGRDLHWTFYAGYRWLSIDYDPGGSFAFDSVISGPLLGLAYVW